MQVSLRSQFLCDFSNSLEREKIAWKKKTKVEEDDDEEQERNTLSAMGNSVARVNGHSYKIVGTLGEGGFSTVYEVRREKRTYALKWVRGVQEQDALERLLLEIQVQKRLRHPNILQLVETEVRVSDDDKSPKRQHQDGHRLLDGRVTVDTGSKSSKEVLMLFPIYLHGSLQTLLEDSFQKESSPFSERECLRFFSDLVDAVQALHELGFAHRDLKPGNILISSSDLMQPILMDFGSIAPLNTVIRNASDHVALCEEAERLSSAPYRPPELWESNGYVPNSRVDGRTDVWQLGCILYAMAFGPYSPFETPKEGVQHLAILNGNVRFPAHMFRFGDEHFSSTFTSFIKWMLIPDIASRPTLDEVRQQLDQIRAGGGSTTMTNSSSNQVALPPPTQVLSFSKLSSEEWADFAAYEKVSKPSSSPSISMHSSEDWGEFTGFERSNATSVVSGTLVWSTNSTVAAFPPTTTSASQQQSQRQRSSRRHSLGVSIVQMERAESLIGTHEMLRDTDLRRALSTRGKLLLAQALDGRAP